MTTRVEQPGFSRGYPESSAAAGLAALLARPDAVPGLKAADFEGKQV
jgi:hypothetical protein